MAMNSRRPQSIRRTSTTPVGVQRTMRNHDVRLLTSLPAGKMVPLAAIPLLREDSVTRGAFRINFEMMETVEILMNAVNVNVKAYLVPNLAFERFKGMDDLNRSYEGIPFEEGDDVIPYLEQMPAPLPGESDIFTYMGKHLKQGGTVNTAYVEAYNQIWNFRAKNRSPDISLRDRLDMDLAPAFWQHTQFKHIVPDFDQAVIDGEVALSMPNSRIPVKGLGLDISGSIGAPTTVSGVLESGTEGLTPFNESYMVDGNFASDPDAMRARMFVETDGIAPNYLPQIYAEMAQAGVTVSLANIEMARRTQTFAMLRRQYTGHSDEYIIDLLMDGISVPEQAWRQPILLADRSTIFGMSKRYASDAANLTESVVNGATFIDVNVTVPRCPTGGVVMLVAEITPEQLFERQKDPYLHASEVDHLPQFLRDTLDPEKVVVVTNDYVDLDHDTPDATFGYAPLNHEWNHSAPHIGGRFYRPEVDAAFDEDRQRLWAVETQNPVLSEDFYLCTTMHTKPFVVTNQDPFEAVVRGGCIIRGNTVFGGMLIEANNDYAEVISEAPIERIEKPEPLPVE